MSHLDRKLLERKLKILESYYGELQELLKSSIKEVKADFVKKYAIERLAQLLVDIMLDINLHIIRREDFNPVDNLQSSFILLGEKGILESSFANKIAPVVGVRNRLVHQYEKIDEDLLLNNLYKNHRDFLKYAKQIRGFISTSPRG